MAHILTLENGTAIELSPVMLDMGEGDAVDFFTLPVASIVAYAKEGNTHVFGNRVSSDVVRRIREVIREAAGKDAEGNYKRKMSGDKTDSAVITGKEVSDWRKANEAETERLETEAANEYRAKVLAGEFAATTRAAGMSSETKMQREAAKRVVAYLLSRLTPARVLPTGKGSAAIVTEFVDSFLADKNGTMTKNKRRYETELAAVRAEAAEAAKPKASLSDIFGGDDEGEAEDSGEEKAAE